MSDRAVPRSYRMMEGFGVHTFRLVDAEGATVLVKFHWKPVLGVHSLTWEEAQLAAGVDPDFHRRDLYDAIESGAHPQWELGIQVFPDTPEQTFEGIDLLDPTKIVPEELAPVQVLGRMTLDRTPTNFFAEVEQVAFHVGHLVPGIDLTDDPLLHARLFSYLDTQITRLGGPNFDQIPVNRPHCPVNDMLRDGYHQHAVHAGVAPYKPNSLDGGLPVAAAEDEGGYAERAVVIPPASTRVRQSPATFDDHFSQARLFWLSMTPVEQEHIIRAYTFELGKCYEQAIRERQLLALARIDARLCREVAAGLGLPAPAADAGDAARAGDPAAGAIPGDADAGQLPVDPVSGAVAVALDEQPSPALSQLGGTWPVEGRIVGVVVDRAAVGFDVRAVADAIRGAGMRPLVVAATGGPLADGTPVQRTFLTARSVEFDALLLAGAPVPAADAIALRDARAAAPATPGLDPRVQLLLDECVRHAKAVAGIGDGRAALEASLGAGVPGVILGEDPADVVASLSELMAAHRVWERFPVEVPLVAPSPAPPGT
jgi:catalase